MQKAGVDSPVLTDKEAIAQKYSYLRMSIFEQNHIK
jgi:hypothetical protein